MIQPKNSVVTVCYNAVNDIEKTILSVINQTYSNVEYSLLADVCDALKERYHTTDILQFIRMPQERLH